MMPLLQLFPDTQQRVVDADIEVDIIAVHGLKYQDKDDTNHSWDTWNASGLDGLKDRMWLRDDLPRSLPKPHIFLYQYDSTVAFENIGTLEEKSKELLKSIKTERRGDETTPIIFLGHSIGGLLIKQALCRSDPEYSFIRQATTSIAFFATPHRLKARKLGWFDIFVRKHNLQKTKILGINHLPSAVHDRWQQHILSFKYLSFWGAYDDIIPRESAQLGLPGDVENIVKLRKDHYGVCKFGWSQADEDDLNLVLCNLRDLYNDAVGKSAKKTLRLRSSENT